MLLKIPSSFFYFTDLPFFQHPFTGEIPVTSFCGITLGKTFWALHHQTQYSVSLLSCCRIHRTTLSHTHTQKNKSEPMVYDSFRFARSSTKSSRNVLHSTLPGFSTRSFFFFPDTYFLIGSYLTARKTNSLVIFNWPRPRWTKHKRINELFL